MQLQFWRFRKCLQRFKW